MIALSGFMNVLAILGLVVGFVVLLVVIFLLQATLAPLRAVLKDLEDAKTAPMLERGVPGTEQLGQTRRLAESVPPLALAYLNKLGAGHRPPAQAPPPGPPGWNPAAPPAPTAPAPDAPRPVAPGAVDTNLPAWQRFQARN